MNPLEEKVERVQEPKEVEDSKNNQGFLSQHELI